MQSLAALLVLCAAFTISAGYYSVDSTYQPNPNLPWKPLANTENVNILPGNNAEINGPPPLYPYGSYPYGRQIPWTYGIPTPYYGPDNNNINSGAGTYGGYSNLPIQLQNWLPWRPLVPQPKPVEQKNSTGTVVEVPIENAVEDYPGEKPFPKNHERT